MTGRVEDWALILPSLFHPSIQDSDAKRDVEVLTSFGAGMSATFASGILGVVSNPSYFCQLPTDN